MKSQFARPKCTTLDAEWALFGIIIIIVYFVLLQQSPLKGDRKWRFVILPLSLSFFCPRIKCASKRISTKKNCHVAANRARKNEIIGQQNCLKSFREDTPSEGHAPGRDERGIAKRIARYKRIKRMVTVFFHACSIQRGTSDIGDNFPTIFLRFSKTL